MDEKWCPRCRKQIPDPGTSDMHKYAQFWRDNRCCYCNSELVAPAVSPPSVLNRNDPSEPAQLLHLTMERQHIEHPSEVGYQYLRKSLYNLARFWANSGTSPRTELTISGYDADPRELYEIPELCEWARLTLAKLPVLPFFLAQASSDRFFGWVCGPISKKGMTSKSFKKKYNDVQFDCVTKASAESSKFFREAGVDIKQISGIYFQMMREQITTKGKEKKWWQFWK